MATHRQLPNDIDIAPFQSKGRWYKAFIEKDESGNAKLTNADAGLPSITPTGYGFTMDGQKNGKDFHLVSAVANPGIGTGTAGSPAFYYPTIGQNYTAEGSQYIVDFNKPETNVSLKINDTAATVQETVNGLVQKNIALSASVESGQNKAGFHKVINISKREALTESDYEEFCSEMAKNLTVANLFPGINGDDVAKLPELATVYITIWTSFSVNKNILLTFPLKYSFVGSGVSASSHALLYYDANFYYVMMESEITLQGFWLDFSKLAISDGSISATAYYPSGSQGSEGFSIVGYITVYNYV